MGISRKKALVAALMSLFAGVVAASAEPAGKDAHPTPKVGDEAKDFELVSLNGDPVKLSRLTDSGPVVLIVLRGYPGYQCPLCTRQVGELLGKADAFQKAGAKVLFIYPGPADKLKEHADEFVKGKDFPNNFQLAIDPDYTFTNAYGLRWDAKNETAYPSTFVLDSKRKILFAKISTTHGNRSNVSDVLKALGAK